jgi:hypothetical protein
MLLNREFEGYAYLAVTRDVDTVPLTTNDLIDAKTFSHANKAIKEQGLYAFQEMIRYQRHIRAARTPYLPRGSK